MSPASVVSGRGVFAPLLLSLLFPALRAADLLEVLPVRGDMVMLQISDGSITHAKGGQKLTDEIVNVNPLKTDKLTASAFTVTSTDDSAYSSAKAASALNRKSKGSDFAQVDENWVDGFGFKPNRPYAVMEHRIYLRLPTALSEGKTYTVAWDKDLLGLTNGTASFTFNPSSLRSEAIHVNVVGYAPAAAMKFGYLYHWAGDLGGIDYASFAGKSFKLVEDSTGATAFTGTVNFRKGADNAETGQATATPGSNFLGASVWECDFSAFSTPGRYRLVIPGLGCSFPFSIDADAYRPAFQAAMKGLYINRSGIELKTPHAAFSRPAPHNVKTTPGFAGRLKYSTTRFYEFVADGGGATDKAKVEAGLKGALTDTWGWYQDAGDWDGYFAHLDIPNFLLALYQIYPGKFSDSELNLPESGNGIPDLVDEGAWLPRFFARQRAELKAKGWGAGGVGSRVFGDLWGDDLPGGTIRGSWQDTSRDWYVTGEDPFSSYRYAAAAAQLAEILATLGKADPEGVNWLQEATEAYAWAGANTKAGEEAVSVYGNTLRHHRALAAVALFRASGDATYHTRFKTDMADLTAASELTNVQALAVALYLSHPNQAALEAEPKDRLGAALKATALNLTEFSGSRRATRYGGNWYFPMVIGQGSTPLIHAAVLGQRGIKNSDTSAAATILSYAYTTADYFLGTNPHNMTWVTGLGPRSPLWVFALDDFAIGQGTRAGRITYGPATFGDYWISQRMNQSIWWAWDTTYPTIDPRGAGMSASGAAKPGTWPGHEAFFDQRGSPQTTEFTVWQNNMPAAVCYGFLAAEASGDGPAIVTQPVGLTTNEGSKVEFSVTVDSTAGVTYQWYHNGSAITGATSAKLVLPLVQKFHAGAYTVAVRRNSSSVTSASAQLIVDTASRKGRLVNLSSRGFSKTGDGVMIAGVSVKGAGQRPLLGRVVGPGLQLFGVSRTLPKPLLELVQITSSGNQLLGKNSDWTTNGVSEIRAKFNSVGAFDLSTSSPDAAITADVGQGNFTVLAQPSDGIAGNVLIELYDLGGTSLGAEMTNLSTRGYAGAGDDVLIAGFNLTTPDAMRMLIRGIGPSIGRAPFNVAGALADPVLELYRREGIDSILVFSSDNWRNNPNADEIPSASEQAGAFLPMLDDKEAVLLLALPSGGYTAILRGAGNASGNGLVELYRVE
ncbi:MAG: glycoside hydrolase family 9 protein [Opitutaceae bacterium]|nr:glycoside hydrolase family 9 protein [Opitutaceae bacterium]